MNLSMFMQLLIGCVCSFWLVSCNTRVANHVDENSASIVTSEETVRINNCGNPSQSEQNKERTFSARIEGAAGINVGFQVLEGSVSAQYGQYRSTTTSQKLIAAPNTNMEFVLKWSEDRRAGNVIVDEKSALYSVHIPISVEQISSRNLGCSTGDTLPSSVDEQLFDAEIPIQQNDSSITNGVSPSQNVMPLRDHHTASIVTGYFTQATYSDGMAPFSQDEVSTNHYRIQVIHKDDPNACGVAIYDSDKVWIASSANTAFTVNGQDVGKLSVDTGKHGYVVNWPVHIGDELCAVGFAPSGFGIIIGPDIYYQYDSYCYRGFC